MVIFILMLVNEELSESENWNFLKYGGIGNTHGNPYIHSTTVLCDTVYSAHHGEVVLMWSLVKMMERVTSPFLLGGQCAGPYCRNQ